jgi:three-Cys-motif partner protein
MWTRKAFHLGSTYLLQTKGRLQSRFSRYEDGSPGSPLLLARTAEHVAAFRDVTGVYVEKNPVDFANLRQVMADHGQHTHHLFSGDLGEHLPEVLRIAQGAALFAFLDPFGTALERAQLVGGLLGGRDRAPVEVLLHFSVSTVARLGGLLRRRHEQGVGVLDPVDAKSLGHVDRFLGGTWWQEHFAPIQGAGDEQRATTVALHVAELFLQDICKVAGCRAVSMPVRRRPDHLPKYVLVLFTRHDDGLWHFADTLGKAGRDWQGAWRAESASQQLIKIRKKDAENTGLFGLEELLASEPFDPNAYEAQHRGEWQAIIESNIRNVLAAEGPFRLADHVRDVYGTVLGAAGEKHVRAAVKALHGAGEVAHTGRGRYFFREWIRPVS